MKITTPSSAEFFSVLRPLLGLLLGRVGAVSQLHSHWKRSLIYVRKCETSRIV